MTTDPVTVNDGRPVIIANGKNPFQLALLAATTIIAALWLFGAESPSLAGLLPGWTLIAWSLVCLLGTLVAQIGIWWRGWLTTGLLIEAAGMIAFGMALAVYAVALFAFTGTKALGAGALTIAIAVGAVWRALQIRRDVRKVHVAVRRGHVVKAAFLSYAPNEGDSP